MGCGKQRSVIAASNHGQSDRNENCKPPEEVEHCDQRWLLMSHKQASSVGAWYQFLRPFSGWGLLLCNVDGRWAESVGSGFSSSELFALGRLGVSIDIF